jgi:HEPN domain-containing protein
VSVEALERPLPKPTEAAYVEARLIEALTEARLALELLERGITRNAAGKAFQAWEALLAALLRLEKLKAAAKTGEEKKRLESTAIPKVPTTKMVSLKLEEVGHEGVVAWTPLALNLHDYRHRGPDPDMALSKFRAREEAAEHVRKLAAETARRAEALQRAL